MVMSVAPAGVNFYFARQEEGDATVFVPMSNIISIATMRDDMLDALGLDQRREAAQRAGSTPATDSPH